MSVTVKATADLDFVEFAQCTHALFAPKIKSKKTNKTNYTIVEVGEPFT